MSHRAKNRHKPRHHTHAQKPASLPKPQSIADKSETSLPNPSVSAPAKEQAKEQKEVVS